MKCPRCKGKGRIPGAKDLLKLRTNRGWSQKRAAIELGISQSYLCEIETGKNPVPMYLIEAYNQIEL